MGTVIGQDPRGKWVQFTADTHTVEADAIPSTGSGVTVTDGSTTISAAEKITFSGATVSGAPTNAHVTVSGGSAASDGFSGSSVKFASGAYLFRSIALTGVSNSHFGTLCFTYNPMGVPILSNITPATNESSFNGNGSGMEALLTIPSPPLSLTMLLTLNDPGANNALTATLNLPAMAPAKLNQILISADTLAGRLAVAVNGRPAFVSIASFVTPFLIDWTGSGDGAKPGFYVGSNTFPGGTGGWGEIFLDTNNSIVQSDGSISDADLAKFWIGGPVALGSDGSAPFGVSPAVYFTGNAASFPTNKGSGGAFILTGSLADS